MILLPNNKTELTTNKKKPHPWRVWNPGQFSNKQEKIVIPADMGIAGAHKRVQ